MTRNNAFLISILLLLSLGVSACRRADVDLTTDDQADIYAAVVEQIFIADDTAGGAVQPERLYLVGVTDERVREPGSEIEPDHTVIDDAVRNGVTARLAALPTEIIWIESADEVDVEADGSVVGGGAIITLGNITPLSADEVHVPASIEVRQLFAGGQTYVVEKIDALWGITGTTGPRWIS